MKESKKLEYYELAVYCLSALLIVSLIGTGLNQYLLIKETTLRIVAEKEWQLVHDKETIQLAGCNNFELFVRVNESGECFRAINQMNNSQFTEVYNVCDQDVLVRCLQ